MAFTHGPVQNRLDSFHVGRQFFRKLPEWLLATWSDQPSIGGDSVLDLLSGIQKLFAVFKCESIVSIEQKVPYVRSRCVDFRP